MAVTERQFGVAEGQALLGEVFAPWVQELGLEVTELDAQGGLFRLPAGDRIVRGGGAGGGVICGQAVAAAADTASVVALSALNGRFRACTTVDLTVHFMRPLTGDHVDIRVDVMSNGRRMAVTRIEFRGAAGKVGASTTCAFAYLED
jgi:uncharacterized protein (TIGR00369 family)